jgi:hypothetical protein
MHFKATPSECWHFLAQQLNYTKKHSWYKLTHHLLKNINIKD